MTHLPDTRDTDLMPAKIVYGCYALGATSICGLIYAYLSRGREAVLDSHLTFQIRTFWISVGLAIVAASISMAGLGLLPWLILVAWDLGRVISGSLLADAGKPVSGTRCWGFKAY